MAALLTLALALTGCGSGGSGGSSGGTTTFNIGFGGPLTKGDVSFGQGGLNATQLAVANANKSQDAKDLGIQFQVQSGDDMSNATTAGTVASGFVSDKKMVGVVGHFNTAASFQAAPVYNRGNLVQISYGSTGVKLTEQGWTNVFRTCARDDLQGSHAADYATKLGFKSVAIVDDKSPYGQGLAPVFKAQFLKNGGKVVFEDETDQGQSDFNSISTKIAATKPDLVYFAGTYSPDTGAGALFCSQLKSNGVTAPMMGADGIYADEFITQAGAKVAEGTMATCPGKPVELFPDGQQFIKDYQAMFKGQTPSPFDAYAYDAANAIINATYQVAKDMGVNKVTSPAGRTALIKAVAASNFDGVTGKVAFDAKGDNKNSVISVYKVVNGKWVIQPEN